jgi:hypothetical protein
MIVRDTREPTTDFLQKYLRASVKARQRGLKLIKAS